MTDYEELNNKITDLIDHIDSEMTGEKDKFLEINVKQRRESLDINIRISYENDIALHTDDNRTMFTYDDYLKMTKEERDNIGGKEWHDLKPEDRMLILDDWGFGDDIEGFKKNI